MKKAKTKKLKYLGPHGEADVIGFGRVKRGGVYDVPSELATNLLRNSASWTTDAGVSASPTPMTTDAEKEE